ncbi:hypothetical protein [Pseudooceanicola aestuarii]|uniref:hypothetical protein n=1 Tax=Pseudooceanicola aestuarii TaxID=2697319 RepID=UPI0013CF8709|nr:hypothetical protein [Pseudooceanicola aestuarii]
MGGLAYIVVTAPTVIPLWRLMPNFRLPEWAALLGLISFGVRVLLWVMAFRDRVRIPGVDK